MHVLVQALRSRRTARRIPQPEARRLPSLHGRVAALRGENKFLNDLAWEINEQSAKQCREWADRIANKTGRPRFVAGAIGPLTVGLSHGPDANDPGFRVATFD